MSIPPNQVLITPVGATSFQEAVVKGVSEIVRVVPTAPVDCKAQRVDTPDGSSHDVRIVVRPAATSCAALDVIVEPVRSVSITVGNRGFFSLPDDVWDARTQNVVTFALDIVRAVAEGKYTETEWYRGGVLTTVRWRACLPSGDIGIRRTCVRRWLADFWRPRTVLTRSYGHY